MGKVHRFLGLKVGLIVHGLTAMERQAAYAADITYGTNNEMGFDYLRDNMCIYSSELVQRGHAFAIVDEVDSILIDEARTPLIISGQGEKSTQLYDMAEMFVSRLKKEVVVQVDDKEEEDADIDADYIVDEKAKTATLTARGIAKAEEFFHVENLSDPSNATLSHHINQAIKAHGTMKRDIDYVVKDGEVIIVDEFTGRLMFGRRYSNGLHQAIEAKEHVNVNSENKTLATITFQNYFRLYDKLSGMTGTAMTEAGGVRHHLQPGHRGDPHQPSQPARRTITTWCTRPEAGKFRAVIAADQGVPRKGPARSGGHRVHREERAAQPACWPAGRHSAQSAQRQEPREGSRDRGPGRQVGRRHRGHQHGRPWYRYHAGRQRRVSGPGRSGEGRLSPRRSSWTPPATPTPTTRRFWHARKLFAERMARHKADIADEAEKVRAAGGLFIIGTERHESRRIDNQLRGRAGRQGDPGETRFYISLEDDLMRLFGGDRIQNMMENFDLDEDTPIENKMLTRAIENAQTTVESPQLPVP